MWDVLHPEPNSRFRKTFSDMYEAKYKSKFEQLGTYYEHRLIDDMVAQVGSKH